MSQSSSKCKLFFFGAALSCLSAVSVAQDLYDPSVLRTVNITFTQSNWQTLLRSNYASETDLAGTVEVDGRSYPNVGIRIRGNTSFTALPAGSEKFSLKLEMDFVNPNQDLMGYDSINLNNGWRDPTFSREVEFNNFVARFVPNARANNVVVTINGVNWGVYNNVQQTDKRLLRDYFANADGLRIRCANLPNGPGLAYNGPNASGYTVYEIQFDGGLADPVGALISVTNTLSNAPLTDIAAIDRNFAIDPSIWTVVLENMLTDDDSYINKGCDFMTYRDPIDERTHLIQRDANETWTQTTWAINRNFTQVNKPFLSRVLSVPELRQRYMAHYRTARSDLNWVNYFEPKFNLRRNLIRNAVAADTKKIYSTALFEANFTSQVTMPGGGLVGGTIPGLQQFVTERANFLNNAASNPELVALGPNIGGVNASNSTPSPTTPVFITASVTAAGNPIAKVELFFRRNAALIYERVAMLDNGASGDGAAGDGVFGALLPVSAAPGLRVAYYVGATATNSFSSVTYMPALAERGPRYVDYNLGSGESMRITEWMYSGNYGEFVEFTNRSPTAIDMTGWSMDDSNNVPGAFSLTAFGLVQPGESVIVTENTESVFRAAWNLAAGVKIIGQLGAVGVGGNGFGRGDQIHVYDSTSTLIDRLFYGDQTFPGTIRTQNASGQAPCSAIGQNSIAAWQLSALGDSYGSVASVPTAVGNLTDIGAPGRFNAAACATNGLFANGFE